MDQRASVYGRQSRGNEKSIREQLSAGLGIIRANKWQHVGDYSDGVGASRFGNKTRSDWDRLIADLDAGGFDILILWESSRGDRTLSSWADLLEKCRSKKVRIHVIADDHTYDLNRPRDWKTLANAGVDAAAETDMLSIRTKRGHAGAAAAGKAPGGPTPYGYRRIFDPATGKRVGQRVHEPEARIVREVFDRIPRDTILGIVNDLTARGVPWRAGDSGWSRDAVRRMVNNPAYIGARDHYGVRHRGDWEPIVTEAAFYTAQQVLSNPARRLTRPGRQKHLLSYLATSAVCGGFLDHVVECYRCTVDGCVSIPKKLADDVVTRFVLARLALPDLASLLPDADRGVADEARGRADRFKSQLDEWRRSAIRGETSPASLAVIEAELTAKIGEAEAKVRELSVAPVLRAILDPGVDVLQRWESGSVITRRAIVRALCEVRVSAGSRGRRSDFTRLGASRWHNDPATWADHWSAGGSAVVVAGH